ncbi:MAG: DUF58 domain-containing protein [Acidobacteriota bacterium]|nr:DUF58 domain-containing protein [Acidobacteriota bacterium]
MFDYRTTLSEGMRAAAHCRFAELTRDPRGKAGFRRGNRAGSSLEYKDFREYQPGDDLRHIDWNAYARTDKLIVKRYHEEITPHLDLIADGSASMDLPETRKAEALIFLTGFFAAVAGNSSFSHTCWRTASDCRPLANSGGDPLTWERLELKASTSPAEAVDVSRPRWRRQGVRILLSDLLFPADPHHFLGKLIEQAAAVLVVQVLAESDLNPALGGMRRLTDSETGAVREIRIDEAARRRYKETLTRHQDAWRDAARETGTALVTFTDETLLSRPIFDDPTLARFLEH